MDTSTTAPRQSADRAGTRQETKAAATNVASTAGEEARRVSGDARDQARHLIDQTRADLQEQAASQQARVASSLRELADQLHEMAESSDQDGVARGLVDDVARRAGDAASWLDSREPGDLLDQARGFARRRPGAFLAIAAGIGVIGGRLSRGLIDESRDDSDTSQPQARVRTPMHGDDLRGPTVGEPVAPAATTPSPATAGSAGIGEPAAGRTTGPTGGSRVASSGASSTGSVPPTPGGSPMAPQAAAEHTGTTAPHVVEDDDESVVRGER